VRHAAGNWFSPRRHEEHEGSQTVIPAKAGTHSSEARMVEGWIPAFAGMTAFFVFFVFFVPSW
jgi:hypothetical protein